MPNLSIIPARAVRDQALSDTQVRVLCAIGTFTNKLGGNVWASVRTLAAQSNLSERTVQRSLTVLIEQGYVKRHERTGRTSIYEVVLDETPDTAVGGGGDTPDGGGVTEESPKRPKETTPLRKSANAQMTDEEAECFHFIWANFPKRDLPHVYVPSRNAVLKLLRSGVPAETLVQAMWSYTDRITREKSEPRFIKSLNKFYEDDYWKNFVVVRVHGLTRVEWIKSGQDVMEFDMLATG